MKCLVIHSKGQEAQGINQVRSRYEGKFLLSVHNLVVPFSLSNSNSIFNSILNKIMMNILCCILGAGGIAQ